MNGKTKAEKEIDQKKKKRICVRVGIKSSCLSSPSYKTQNP